MTDDVDVDPLGSVSRSTLHFFWIADCSGSMRGGGKIQSLNNSIHECLPATRESAVANPFAEMAVRAIKFSSGAQWHVEEPTSVEEFVWEDLEAGGITDLGAAIRLLSSELDPERMGRRNLPPVVVLLSDGAPTDDWQKALAEFNDTGWGQPGRTVRVAIAIGADADKDVLAQFTGSRETVFQADNAQRLTDLIKWASVTLSRYASSGASQVGGSPKDAAPIPPPPVPAIDDEDEIDDTW